MGTFDLRAVLLALPVPLLSLAAHPFGHAWVALEREDDRAYMPGRVSTNPRARLDRVGTVIYPAISIGTGAPRILWRVIAGTSNLLPLPLGDQT
ncbi:MAG TPA: hypothetical protein VGX50_20460 [Longimicrobium sp.]|nr:hypothetical protein [Longimicrobium sp.]